MIPKDTLSFIRLQPLINSVVDTAAFGVSIKFCGLANTYSRFFVYVLIPSDATYVPTKISWQAGEVPKKPRALYSGSFIGGVLFV